MSKIMLNIFENLYFFTVSYIQSVHTVFEFHHKSQSATYAEPAIKKSQDPDPQPHVHNVLSHLWQNILIFV